MLRYGGQAANFTADDLTQSPGEEDIDLQDLMRKLSAEESTADVSKEIESQGLYKSKGNVSNYDISNALYGTAEDEAVIEDIGGKFQFEVLFDREKITV